MDRAGGLGWRNFAAKRHKIVVKLLSQKCLKIASIDLTHLYNLLDFAKFHEYHHLDTKWIRRKNASPVFNEKTNAVPGT
jgi:hypothetical protein